jgi:hypothetical protein
VNERPKISEQAKAALREELVPDVAVAAAECMLGHVAHAAETVAREYDEAAGDDKNLAGLMVSRRGKNVAAGELRAEEVEGVVVRPSMGFTWDINAGGTRLHTYSAPSGLDGFQLVGGDRKANIVGRSVEQLSLFEESGAKQQPGDLVLAYVRDRRGLSRACLGVMKSEDEFAWQVPVYEADESSAATTRQQQPERGPSFREQPEKRPNISLKPPREKREKL